MTRNIIDEESVVTEYLKCIYTNSSKKTWRCRQKKKKKE